MKRGKKKKTFVVRPWSDGVCPTADELRAAWANRRRSQKDFIVLLSVLGELTCFTDYTLEHRGGFGNIGGRRGGLKAFLAENAPELLYFRAEVGNDSSRNGKNKLEPEKKTPEDVFLRGSLIGV